MAGDLDRTLRACRCARVAALDDAHRAQEVKKSAARVATARAHTVPPTEDDNCLVKLNFPTKESGGKSICVHNRQRSRCKE